MKNSRIGLSKFWLLKQIVSSSVIVAILLFILVNFYILSSIINLQTFIYVFLVISALTDGLIILIHLPRRKHKHSKLNFDPNKVTVIIACYNGEDVIGESIAQVKRHVPANQIIVVSDASTDKTAEIAKKAKVQVIINQRNVNKAFSISRAVHYVKTPYTLILDDDTLIGNTLIPTSLLDEGYTAVAFDVMPYPEATIVNRLQRYEYRKSMQLGKSLRSKAGAIGNVSGAIGLFQTQDLVKQVRLHSGQFGGEDEQRTTLAHIYSEGRGIVFSNSTVLTRVPDTWSKLLRQRSFRWNLSLPELFVLYMRILLSPNHHYLLKSEKAYQLYIFLTDPLRIIFFLALLLRPSNILLSYLFYFALSIVVWLRTKCKDPWWVVVLYPPYSLIMNVCRFVAYFYWLKIKTRDIFKDKFYKVANKRNLILEYSIAILVFSVFWAAAILHFRSDAKIANKYSTNRLDDSAQQFNYDSIGALPSSGDSSGDSIKLTVTPVDSTTSIAHRAIDVVLAENEGGSISPAKRDQADFTLAQKLQQSGITLSKLNTTVPRSMVVEVVLSYQEQPNRL